MTDLLVCQSKNRLGMTDKHDTETCRLVVNFRDCQTCSIDRYVSFLDNVRHLSWVFKLEIVSYRITIWLLGNDGCCCIYVTLFVSLIITTGQPKLTWTICPPNLVCPAIARSQFTLSPSASLPIVINIRS
jgi:hypothetical protein